MKTIIKRKFIEVFQYLQQTHFFETKKEFAAVMNISPQFLSQMLNDNTPVPLEFLSRFMQTYPINSGFFFKNEAQMLMPGTPLPHDVYKTPNMGNSSYSQNSKSDYSQQNGYLQNGNGTGLGGNPYNNGYNNRNDYSIPQPQQQQPYPSMQHNHAQMPPESRIQERGAVSNAEIARVLAKAAEAQEELVRLITKLRLKNH